MKVGSSYSIIFYLYYKGDDGSSSRWDRLSVYLVKEVNKLLEIYFVIRLHPSYLYHC
jgi:hypothetical protein